MNDPKNFLVKATKFLRQQQELFGDFSVKNEATKTSTQETEIIQSTSEAIPDKTDQNPGNDDDNLPPVRRIANCKTLVELRALCEEAEELKTDLEGTNLVFGVGNPNADLMIIGEAPGYNEDQQGEPFVGQAGQLLDKIMEAINFKREEVYIANILKHRPPNNRDPKAEERQRSLPFLLRQIELIDPKLILCVGRISATTLLGEDTSLSRLRQKFHPFHGRELMATYHPAALLRNQKWKRPTWEDVQLLRKRYDELTSRN